MTGLKQILEVVSIPGLKIGCVINCTSRVSFSSSCDSVTADRPYYYYNFLAPILTLDEVLSAKSRLYLAFQRAKDYRGRL